MRTAFEIAGRFAVVFGAVFFLFLVSTILLVGGDGTAPRVTYMSGAIMSSAARLLGVPEESGVVAAVLLWSSIVYATVFVVTVLRRTAIPATSKSGRGLAGFLFFGALAYGMLVLHQEKGQKADQAREQELVLDLVRKDQAVVHKVGVIDLISVAMSTETNGQVDRYQIYVRGKRDETFHDLYAVVDVSRGSAKPNYLLRCTNLEIAYVSARENPCKGGAK